MQDKRPHNEKGLPHGYWVVYFTDGNILHKANYIDNQTFGYVEWCLFNQKRITYYAR